MPLHFAMIGHGSAVLLRGKGGGGGKKKKNYHAKAIAM
jgi:hypothetical protein